MLYINYVIHVLHIDKLISRAFKLFAVRGVDLLEVDRECPVGGNGIENYVVVRVIVGGLTELRDVPPCLECRRGSKPDTYRPGLPQCGVLLLIKEVRC